MKKREILVVAIILMNVYCAFGQIWQKTYGFPGIIDFSNSVTTSSDDGFLMAIITGYNTYASWIVKSDINGNVLWTKYLTQASNEWFRIRSLTNNENGDIILTGTITLSDSMNMLVVKLNPCGEMLWCKRNNQNAENGAGIVKELLNHHNIILAAGLSDSPLIDRYQLFEIEENGNIIWMKQVLPGTEYYYENTQFYQMCLTSDGGSLMAGYTYYPYDTTTNPYDAVLQPCLVKCDSLGDMQWVYPPLSGADTTKIGFFAGCAQIGNTYYAVGSHYDTTEFFLRPLVARFDLNGNLQSYICSEPDTMYHSLSQVLPVSDTSILLISAANNIFTDPNYLMVFLSDTMGHFTKAFTRTDLVVGQYGDEAARLRDNKFVIACQFPIGWPGANTDVVAIKLNANLEYDSIYTQAFIYDSLCPYPIVSDTIICNCEPFVTVEEAESITEILNLYPNPATDHFVINCGQEKSAGGTLLIYDFYGRLKYLVELPPGRSQSIINCDHWKPGLYFARWENGGKAVSGKVIVK